MVSHLGAITKPIYPTMRWYIIADTYRHIDWVMGYMCRKYQNEILRVFKITHGIYFDDGIDINEFRFVSANSVEKLKGTHADIYMGIEDFREMWLLQ